MKRRDLLNNLFIKQCNKSVKFKTIFVTDDGLILNKRELHFWGED